MAIKIVTDSTSYIPEEFINKYDISVVSLNVIMNGESIREVDLDNETFYSKMEESTEIPSSSQPSPDEIYNTFENIIKEGNSIVGIFISSDMSGTVSSANLIKNMLLEKYPTAHIEIVDSRSNCMQMGYVAIEAAKAAAAGKSMEEVIDVCTSVITNSSFLFTHATLEYLKKGGRSGGTSALLGTLFQIKPILTVCDGKTTVFTKVRTKKKAVDTLVTTLVNDLQGKELGGVIVHHINCQDEGLSLAAKIKKQLGVDVQIDTIGPIIGLHVGPGSIGVAYFTK